MSRHVAARLAAIGTLVTLPVGVVASQAGAHPDTVAAAKRARAYGVLVERLDSAVARANDEYNEKVRALRVDSVRVGRLQATLRGVAISRARELLRGADSAWAHSWASSVPFFDGARIEMTIGTMGESKDEWISSRIDWPQPGSANPRTGMAQAHLVRGSARNERGDVAALASLVLEPWIRLRPALASTPPMTVDTVELARSAYEELAASPFLSGRSCLAGKLPACEQVLALRPFVAPFDEALDAAGRVALLSAGDSYDWPVSFEDRRACLETMDEAVCRQAMAKVPGTELRSFHAYQARRLLALTIMRQWARSGLLRADGARKDPDEDVHLLVGDSLEMFLERTRQTALLHRPHRVLPAAATSWFAIALLAVFLVVGARSSRWRIE